MKYIIVDDEPVARDGIKSLVDEVPQLVYLASFNNAKDASVYMEDTAVDLIFLDINMPGINGIEFARSVPKQTLIIFTTAYSRFALDSYEVDAVDYLVKPIEPERFHKAVEKAILYHSLLVNAESNDMEADEDFMFVKSDRRFLKVQYSDILFIEGLKNYVVIHTEKKKIVTKIYLSAMIELLPAKIFFRLNKSYIVNKSHIESFDNNDVVINSTEIAIGSAYREEFFRTFATKKI